MNKEKAKHILELFCSMKLSSGEGIFKTFAGLPGAIFHDDGLKNRFVYIPGEREDRVLLVAHADTYWDYFYFEKLFRQEIKERIGVYYGVNEACGIGADDRAGCAMLWLLKDSGHSLLIVDGEEHGQLGSNHIKTKYPELFDDLNRHSYMLQLDRRGSGEYKVYNLPVTDEFIRFVEESTGYSDAGKTARTDIVALCRDICGVNLSIGYYNEHTPDEVLVFDEWFKTLELVEKILLPKQKKYPMKGGAEK